MVKSKPRTGKKKIEIKRIEKTAARDVCFSKRCRGLIKKAGELSLLCDANIACVVFSRGGKAFSFGHPSVDDVANRLASMAMGTSNNPSVGGRSHNSGEVTDILQRQLKHEHVELKKSLLTHEEDKQTMEKQEMEKETVEKETGGHLMEWLNSEVNILGVDELEELQYKLLVVHVDVSARLY
uniref:MADS-box domain-containing protein n=1 Tax=Leersia perrieri TaxID=77586 RepID=A0A0D9WF69_9ORYZ